MILSNSARCLKCGSELSSSSVHDYKECECGNVFVDGGMAYIRHGFLDRSKWLDISISLDDLPCEMIMSAIDWGHQNKRNELGILCAIARGLRDCGYEIREIK